jgi:hypothetical protein
MFAMFRALSPSYERPVLTIRLATGADEPRMRAIMDRAIAELLKPYLPPAGVAASFEIMGLDSQLIADNTYFAVCDDNAIIGCGGWSRRATLFGGDHSEAATPRCSIRPKTQRACAQCIPTRRTCAAAPAASSSPPAKTQRAPHTSAASNSPPPSPANHSTALAATL